VKVALMLQMYQMGKIEVRPIIMSSSIHNKINEMNKAIHSQKYRIHKTKQ